VAATHEALVVMGEAWATRDPAVALEGAELVILAAPAFAHAPILRKIATVLRPGTWVGALPGSGGFDQVARKLLPSYVPIFGSARSPYNVRVQARGALCCISGVAPSLEVASARGTGAEAHDLLHTALGLPVRALPHFLAATLCPGSVIFHPARLDEILASPGARPEAEFYRDWGDAASEVYLACDKELAQLRDILGLDGAAMSAARHYGVGSPSDLTRCIRALKGLPRFAAPALKGSELACRSTAARFLREDLPYGLALAAHIGALVGHPMPRLTRLRRRLEAASPVGRAGPPAILRGLDLAAWRAG
jgi:hypothetical protein